MASLLLFIRLAAQIDPNRDNSAIEFLNPCQGAIHLSAHKDYREDYARTRVLQDWVQLETLKQPLPESGIVGDSAAMRSVSSMIERFAPYKGTVLILGESGVGKELVARALHRLSPTRGGPFVSFDCSNLIDTLAESQLFGHSKGAFTDARQAHLGCFRQANGGALMLDEVGELPFAMQSKLLRVVDTLEVQPVGSIETHRVDLRLLAATNRDLRQMVAAGEFRADLYYRLDLPSIRVPALREHPEDVPALCAHFIDHYNHKFGKSVSRISRRALNLLTLHRWPGNVRELTHSFERAVLLTDDDRIDLGDLPEDLIDRARESGQGPDGHGGAGAAGAGNSSNGSGAPPSLDDVMKTAVQRSLIAAGGDCAKAARILGISRPAIYRKMARYDISSTTVRTLRYGPPRYGAARAGAPDAFSNFR
jgi:DNA-binding NtrC family response regulator